MCDYSLTMVASRPAKVGEKLTTKPFGAGTTGFVGSDEPNTAVCLLPGTEVAFDNPVKYSQWVCHLWSTNEITSKSVARFRQIDKDKPMTHHDALEFADGEFVLLTRLAADQTATVLQLPAAPRNEEEAKEQERLAIVA